MKFSDLRRVAVTYWLLCAVCVPLSAAAGPYFDYATGLAATPPKGSMYRPDLEAELLKLANGYRAEEGRKPLAASDEFLIAARAHAADMMLNDFVGHTASTGQGFQSRMTAFAMDITRFPSIGENAARDTQKGDADAAKARRLFRQWVDSRPHRKNLVSKSFQFVSTGVIQKGNRIWAVQIFFAAPRQKGLFQ